MKRIICLFLITIVGVLFVNQAKSQAGSVLKSLFKAEGQSVGSAIVKEEASSIAVGARAIGVETSIAAKEILVSSKALSQGHSNNLKNFFRKYGEDIVEISSEAATNIAEQIVWKDKDKKLFLNEILTHPDYPKLYNIICERTKKDKLSQSEIECLLLGLPVNKINLDSNRLYNIYFIFSNTFAKSELEKLKIYYNCDKTKKEEIEKIAKKRKVVLNDKLCKSEKEESSTFEIILGLLVFISLIYLSFRIVSRIFRFFKKK
jgi:hypothetical protein